MSRKKPDVPDGRWREGFYSGALSALAVVYDAGDETTAEEIIRAVGTEELLEAAIREDDYKLPLIRDSVRCLRARSRRYKRGLS